MRSSLISAIVLLLAGAAAYAQTPTAGKIGVISIQNAILKTKDGQKASQQLQTEFGPKEQDVKNKQNEIQQLTDQLQKGGNLMTQEKRDDLSRQIEDKKRDLQREVEDDRDALQEEQQKLLQGIEQRMVAVIEKYAKDNGYKMVLDVSNPNTPVIYAANAIIITDQIAALYDKTTVNGAPAPAAPGQAAPKTLPPSASAKPPAVPQH